MSTLVEYRQAVADTLSADATISALTRHVGPHGGKITLDTLKMFAHKTPALLVTVSSAKGNIFTGANWAEVTCEAYILSTLVRGNSKRNELGMLISGAVMIVALSGSWSGISCAKRPENVALTNLYSDKGDKGGVDLWGVRWNQKIEITNGAPDGLVPLEDIDIDYNIDGGDPQVDAEDLVELEQP